MVITFWLQNTAQISFGIPYQNLQSLTNEYEGILECGEETSSEISNLIRCSAFTRPAGSVPYDIVNIGSQLNF